MFNHTEYYCINVWSVPHTKLSHLSHSSEDLKYSTQVICTTSMIWSGWEHHWSREVR